MNLFPYLFCLKLERKKKIALQTEKILSESDVDIIFADAGRMQILFSKTLADADATQTDAVRMRLFKTLSAQGSIHPKPFKNGIDIMT